MAALTALKRKNFDVNGGEPKKAALLALNWRNSGSNGVELENSEVNGAEPEKWRP